MDILQYENTAKPLSTRGIKYHTLAFLNEAHNFVLVQGASKLSAKNLMADNFLASWAKTKLCTLFESADVWYWCLKCSMAWLQYYTSLYPSEVGRFAE